MTTRDRPADRGRREAIDHLRMIGRELRDARVAANLSQQVVAAAAGISHAEISRIEHGAAQHVPLPRVEAIAAVLGLRLHLRLYPAGRPVHDAAQLALLERLRVRLHPGLRMTAEVVLPVSGDLRAWDAAIRAQQWAVFVDAETRVRDVQLVQRRFAVKRRDAGTDRVLLLLADTRFHRELIRSLGTPLVDGALPAEDFLAALAAGRDPCGPGLILL